MVKRKFTTRGKLFEGKKISYHTDGYPVITLNHKPIKIHLLIWERVNGKIPDDCQIHHKDFNKENYIIDNLELVTIEQHQRLHHGWIRNENGIWIAKTCSKCNQILPLSEFWSRIKNDNNHLHSRCKKCHNNKERKR
jgi:hypothetical protein